MKLRILYIKNIVSHKEADMLMRTLKGLVEDKPMWVLLPEDVVTRIDYVGDGWSIKDLIKRILNLIIYKLQIWCKNAVHT